MTGESAFLTDTECTNPELRDRWRALNGLSSPRSHVGQHISATEPTAVHPTVASPTRTTISTWALRGPIA